MTAKLRATSGLSPTAMRHFSVQRLLPLFFGLLLLMAAGPAFAQEKARVLIDVIVANNDGANVDPALRAHAKQLRTQFQQFSNFTRTHSSDLVLIEGESQRVNLPGRKDAFVTLKGVEASQYIIQIKVPGGQTTLKGRAGGMMFIGGPKAPKGTILILIQIK